MSYPISKTQIIWDAPDNPELPPVALVQIPGKDDNRYHASWGACNSDFNEASVGEQVNMLMKQFVHMTINYGIEPELLHETFMQIPEYRRALADCGVIDPALADDAED
jgi:hypothetical protein